MAKSLDMTEGKPSKLLLQFAIPLIIGNLFQQAYTLADRVIVGQFVGADAYSAVGATTALTNLFMSVCMGMSIGAGVVVAQYFGAKDEENTACYILILQQRNKHYRRSSEIGGSCVRSNFRRYYWKSI